MQPKTPFLGCDFLRPDAARYLLNVKTLKKKWLTAVMSL